MSYFVRAPGTCGEFVQGAIGDTPFLVTCPINRYSFAMSEVAFPLPVFHCSLQPKSALAQRRVCDLFKAEVRSVPVYMRSDIVQGKGMASSSADISVVAMATALALGRPLSMEELATIALSIEPSDAAFYPGVTQFDYVKGRITEPLGPCPPMSILIFDEGGEVDTISFNQRTDLQEKIREKDAYVTEALALMKEGIRLHDLRRIGQAATISAFANQRILYKEHLYGLHEIGQAFHSVGTIVAHSGTVMGLLFPVDMSGLEACRRAVETELPALTFVDAVQTASEGITYGRL